MLVATPLAGLLDRTADAFLTSLAWLVVLLAAAIPWIVLFLALSWLSLKFLRWWVKRKREARARKNNATP